MGMEPRSAAAAGKDFPYESPTTCYIEVRQDGLVTQGIDPATYGRARSGESRIFAVWPGQWRSDLFIIDDLDEYAKAVGLVHDEERTGLAEHVHEVRWAVSPYEANPQGTYISIDVWLDCGCKVLDRAAFANQMRQQRGWAVATSGGWGSSSDSKSTTYTLRARRKSLS
jgi:hypothetical protein